jgi:hypothetical protein
MHLAEICNLGDALELIRRDGFDAAEDGRHGIVDPDIDLTPLSNDAVCRVGERLRISDIGNDNQCLPACRLEIAARAFEGRLVARNKGDTASLLCKTESGGPADARRRASYDDNGITWYCV